jgi:hypothetical protein
MRNIFRTLTALVIMASVSSDCSADLIGSLYNTGVSSTHTVLPDGTVGDPHYSLISVPGGTTQTLVRSSTGGFPIPPWLGDDASSAWIGPDNAADLDGPAGQYIYRTTFDLTGLTPGTASISGQWSTDNLGVDILINGVSTGQSISNPESFRTFTSFVINSGFVEGVNTIDFVVLNQPYEGRNPTGLRVEMTGTAAVTPEPAMGLAWGVAVIGVISYPFGCWLRRRQRASLQFGS